MASVLGDLNGLSDEERFWVIEECRSAFHRQAVESEINQRETINRLRHTEERRAIDGVGRHRMRVDANAFHYWGQRLGYDCWDDEQFKREYERDNPESRVICRGTKIQVGATGRNVKWFKNYGDISRHEND